MRTSLVRLNPSCSSKTYTHAHDAYLYFLIVPKDSEYAHLAALYEENEELHVEVRY
jgi:hypothetical protein